MAYGVALISVSLALSQTRAYTARPQTRGYCIVNSVPVYSQLSLVLIVPTHGEMARL